MSPKRGMSAHAPPARPAAGSPGTVWMGNSETAWGNQTTPAGEVENHADRINARPGVLVLSGWGPGVGARSLRRRTRPERKASAGARHPPP